MKAFLVLAVICLNFYAIEGRGSVEFLTDYFKLSKPVDGSEDLMYVAPTAFEELKHYNKIFIDQPEIFISPDSEYRGMKADEMKLIADSLRESVSDVLRTSYEVVDQPGVGVLFIRIALVDLYLRKAERSLMSYLPFDLIDQATKTAFQNEVTRKISLVEVTIEGELLDSSTNTFRR